VSRLEQAARRSFGRHLQPNEEVLATVDAYASATGPVALRGAGIGALCGGLAWTFLDGSGLLPLLILGSLAGIIAGIAVAARRVRPADGPGALMVKLVLTNTRLILIRRPSAARLKPLRTYPADEIEGIDVTPAAVGDYRHLAIRFAAGSSIRLLARGGESVDRLPAQDAATASGQVPQQPAARQDGSSG
jgi:hypothetical protein